ncbi:hypothetical protein Amuc03_01917 [Akkermansia muciniphila]
MLRILHILRQVGLQHLLQQFRNRHLPLVEADQRLPIPHRHPVRVAVYTPRGGNLPARHTQFHALLKRRTHPGSLPVRHPRSQVLGLGIHIRPFGNAQPGGLGQLPGRLHRLGPPHILKHVLPGLRQLVDHPVHGKRLLGLQHPQANPVVQQGLHPRRGVLFAQLQNIVRLLSLRIPDCRGKPPTPIPQILHAGQIKKLHLRLISLLTGQP